MKKWIAAACCAMAFSAQAQTNDELLITADMKWLPNDSLVTLLDTYGSDWDSTSVKDHKFTIRTKLPKGGALYYIKIGTSNENPEQNVLIHYFEPGKVEIKAGKQPGFKYAKTSGSAFVKDWNYITDNISEISPKYSKIEELQEKANKAGRLGDQDAADALQTQVYNLTKQRDEEALAWLRKNPNSGAGTYMVMAWLKPKDSLIRTLGPHAQNTRLAKRILDPKFEASPYKASFGPVDNKPTPAPAFSSLDMNGKVVKLEDFRGKYVFIDFWASWCKPCKAQIPFLKAANEKFKNKNFVMIGVSLDYGREPWMKAVDADKMDWLQLSELKGWKEPVAQAYNVTAIPFNVLIDPDGKIIAKGLYNADLEKVLAEHIK